MADIQTFEAAVAPLQMTASIVYLILLPHYQHGVAHAIHHYIGLLESILPFWAHHLLGPALRGVSALVNPASWLLLFSLPTLYCLEAQLASGHGPPPEHLNYVAYPGVRDAPWTCPAADSPRIYKIAHTT